MKIKAKLLSVPGRFAVATVCMQCDQPESKCACEKYCCCCQAQTNIRLCVDGLYYCPDCREACDVRLGDSEDKR